MNLYSVEVPEWNEKATGPVWVCYRQFDNLDDATQYRKRMADYRKIEPMVDYPLLGIRIRREYPSGRTRIVVKEGDPL